jgi:hypothetical protein
MILKLVVREDVLWNLYEDPVVQKVGIHFVMQFLRASVFRRPGSEQRGTPGETG